MKKIVLLAAALLLTVASHSSADALFFVVKSTPYDHQMDRIRSFLNSSNHGSSDNVSLDAVNHWIAGLRSIPYGFTSNWKTPAETESGSPADCKAKAVALYDKMQSSGAKNVRLVIGKRTASSQKTHAWLAWETANGSYILDPTFNWSACPTARAGKKNYQALYAYAGEKKFQAAAALVAQN